DLGGYLLVPTGERPPPASTIRDATATEGNAGTRLMTFTVTLSVASGQPVTIDFATADGSAVAATGLPAGWLSLLGLGPPRLTARDWAWDSTADRVTVRVGKAAGMFGRGMLAGLTLMLGEWYEVASRALSVWPVEQVTITDVPGLSFSVSAPTPPRPGWVLTGTVRVPGRRGPLAGGWPLRPGPAPPTR